jgi:DNA modification methylase
LAFVPVGGLPGWERLGYKDEDRLGDFIMPQQDKAGQPKTARTELIWDGKYDAAGNRVAPLRVALPFQTVETVNESVQERQKNLLLEAPGAYAAKDWRNRLIWGDKKYVLPSLLAEFAGKVNLIYYDPPFDTGADFSFTANVPDHPDEEDDETASFTKLPSIIEQKAYRDTWGGASTHLDAYLKWFYETAVLSHELLHETGSLYVHLDWRVVFYVKAILDEVFGADHFVNDIVWKRSTNTSSIGQIWKRAHDVILFYTKSDRYTFNFQYKPLSEASRELYKASDDKGKYQLVPVLVSGKRGGSTGEPWRGIDPNKRGKAGMHWVTTPDKLEEYHRQGLIVFPEKEGGIPRLKYYLEGNKGVVVSDLWDDISLISSSSNESLSYPTQKPELLLERIVKASSNHGDLVMDIFGGSGTTAAVAEKQGRRWITGDLGRFAIHTIRKRLLAIPDVRPFVVQNLGKYERQLWAGAEFGDGTGKQAAVRQRAYVEFILKLYQAKPIHGYTWLHGLHGGRMVHVGAVDGPVTANDVTQMAVEFKKAIGKGADAPKTNGIDVLGWDFAFELNEVSKQQAQAANIQLRFIKIPRDVMDRRAVEQGDVKFFELAALAVEAEVKKQEVTLRLKDFVIPPDDVPEEVRKSVRHWSQWIDYWAVDWDNKGDTFHNEWQTYRTRKEPKLALETAHTYAEKGEYKVVVKVIDILGNDTTKTVKVKVK